MRGGGLRGLTFEVTRARRWGAWPARCMMNQGASRAKCPAAGPRVDRGVRRRWCKAGRFYLKKSTASLNSPMPVLSHGTSPISSLRLPRVVENFDSCAFLALLASSGVLVAADMA